jgi:teichuronic acid biosynthesis glycosyltransferase TuaC
VVTTDVGGNKEVVVSEAYGLVVPFGDQAALRQALHDALLKTWDTRKILDYAQANSWNHRVECLMQRFEELTRG